MLKSISTLPALAMLSVSAPWFFQRLFSYNWYSQPIINGVKAAQFQAGDRLLELGCGPGNLTHHLADQGFDITGVDKSDAMIAKAKQTQSAAKFQCANAYNLPFKDAQFDGVISSSLINIVPKPQTMINEISRVLKPSGRAVLFYPTPEFNDARANAITNELGLGFFQSAALRLWAQKAQKLDAKTLLPMLTTAGFKITNTTMYLQNSQACIIATKIKV